MSATNLTTFPQFYSRLPPIGSSQDSVVVVVVAMTQQAADHLVELLRLVGLPVDLRKPILVHQKTCFRLLYTRAQSKTVLRYQCRLYSGKIQVMSLSTIPMLSLSNMLEQQSRDAEFTMSGIS